MHSERPSVLAAFADSVVDALTPCCHRSLSPEEIDSQLREVREESAGRRRLSQVRAYRKRWNQLTEEEVADLVVHRIHKRASHRIASPAQKGRELVTR